MRVSTSWSPVPQALCCRRGNRADHASCLQSFGTQLGIHLAFAVDAVVALAVPQHLFASLRPRLHQCLHLVLDCIVLGSTARRAGTLALGRAVGFRTDTTSGNDADPVRNELHLGARRLDVGIVGDTIFVHPLVDLDCLRGARQRDRHRTTHQNARDPVRSAHQAS